MLNYCINGHSVNAAALPNVGDAVNGERMRFRSMNWYSIRTIGMTIIMLLMMPSQFFAQTSAHHTVTVIVQPISLIGVNVSSVQLTVSGSDVLAGQEMMIVSDLTTRISWGTNSSMKKIAVHSNISVPKFILTVTAVNPSAGVAAGEVTLSTVNADLLLNIGRTSGSSVIQFTGKVLPSQGIGTDIHTVTYTIISQ